MSKLIPLHVRPLYLQLRDSLVARITAGDWKPGQPIPNEQQIGAEFGVSTGTVRKALEEMEAERIVVRRQGRGTFISDPNSKDLMHRFSNVRDGSGNRVEGEVLQAEMATSAASTEDCQRLQIQPGQEVVRIKRLLADEGRPFSLNESVLPKALFRTMPADADRQHICALAPANGIILSRSSERVSIDVAGGETARLLNLPPGAPVLLLDRIIYTSDGRPAEWRLARCNLGKRHYLVDIT